MKKLVLIGDSIRMGYQDTVKQELAGVCETWFPAENGQHTVNLLLHFYDWIAEQKPDILHINAGAWDVRNVMKRSFGQNIVPLEQYTDNVRYLLDLTKQYTKARIIWATITPMDQEQNHATHAATTDPARRVSDIAEYNESAVRICKRLGVQVNDLYAFVEGVGASTLRNTDGVHFTDEGSRVLGKEVGRDIRTEL